MKDLIHKPFHFFFIVTIVGILLFFVDKLDNKLFPDQTEGSMADKDVIWGTFPDYRVEEIKYLKEELKKCKSTAIFLLHK